jgi:hypothetical protein
MKEGRKVVKISLSGVLYSLKAFVLYILITISNLFMINQREVK